MAFSTASNITSVDGFISALIAFAVANAGFVDHGTDNAGDETLFRMSKIVDGVQTWYGLRLETAQPNRYSDLAIASRMMLELPTDSNFQLLTNGQRAPTIMGLFNIQPTYTGYSFFTDGITVFAALELASGIFAHISFGNITKVGVWSGGAHLMANNFQTDNSDVWRNIIDPSHNGSSMVFGARANSSLVSACYIRYNIGGSDESDFTKLGGRDHNVAGSLLGASGTMSPDHSDRRVLSSATSTVIDMYKGALDASPSEITFIAPLLPVLIFRQHSVGTISSVVPLGHVPNVASINLTQLADKDLVNTNWRVFPLCTQVAGGATATPSDIYGIAYREIP